MSYKLIWLGLFVLAALLMAFGRISRKQKVIFFGDSITQAATQPKGYIDVIRQLAEKEGSLDNYELLGAGISGNKVYDLYLRLETDVLSRSPNTVILFIGVNDIWHKRLLGTGTDYDKFQKFYEAIVAKLRSANIRVIICTPAVVGERTDHSNELDGDLNLYSQWIRDFATKNGVDLVDLRHHFLEYNLQHNKENKDRGILTTDRVHLNDEGNRLVAEKIWSVLKTLR